MISNVFKYKYSEIEKSSKNQEDFLIVFSYDPDTYQQKPTSKKEVGKISNRVLNNRELYGNINQLAQLVATGHAVSPSIFVEKRDTKGFLMSNMIFLDFDNTLSIEEFFKTSTDYNLLPNLIYPTYRHHESSPRFRAVYMIDRTILNQKVYKYLLNGFGELFQGSDKKCRDVSRIFFGTNATGIIDYTNDEVINIKKSTPNPGNYINNSDLEVLSNRETFGVSIISHQPNSYDYVKTLVDQLNYQPFNKHGNHSRNISSEDPQKITCIYVNGDGKIDPSVVTLKYDMNSNKPKSDVKRENYYNIYSISHQTSLFPVLKTPQGIQRVEKVNFDDLAKRSDMFREFVTGEIWKKTHYRHIFNLAYNLKWVKGGLDYMLGVMKRNNRKGLTDYTDNEFSCVKLAKSSTYEYYPPSLFGMKDLYLDDYERWGNILNAVTNQKRGSVEIIKEKLPKPISLNSGENLLKETFQNVINQKTKGTLDLIQGAIGIGKTNILINEIDHKQSRTIIAFVTHQLKNQFIKNLNQKGYSESIDFIATPQVPVFDDKNHNIHLEHLFMSQEFKKAKKYIHSISQQEKKTGDVIKAMKYLIEYTGFIDALLYNRFEGTIITTHSMCHYFDFHKLSPKHDTYIFDEDLFAGGLISTDYLLLDDLKNVCDASNSCSKAFKDILCRDAGIYINDIDIPLSLIRKHLSTLDGVNNKAVWKKLLELKQSKAFAITKEIKKQKDVYKLMYSKRIRLKPQMKYVVLSGTAPENLYRFEGIKTKVHNDCKFIKKKGKLIQYTAKSFSQSSLSKSEKLPDNPNNLPVITFMKHKDKFDNAIQNIHIFNSLGYNDLEGKDFMVIGTPHVNPHALALLAIEAGLSVDLDDKILMEKSLQELEHNGIKFKMFTFSNETLRNLSSQLTESELQQTVGRARLLRYDATVHLYSNFPLWMADEFVY